MLYKWTATLCMKKHRENPENTRRTKQRENIKENQTTD